MPQPFLSIIVPAHNCAQTIRRCLDALKDTDAEVIVVDDSSTDDTRSIVESYGVKVRSTPTRSGPAAARNLGAAEALGEILVFIDSDVLVTPTTLPLLKTTFSENPDVAAVFGSYDDEPEEKNFFSQFKNLMHHFVHQNSDPAAVTFWAGCGAIRKEVFRSVGGFHANEYTVPSIEDIELGLRLNRLGHRVKLEKNIQVKHLKHWTGVNLIRTDIWNRAIPWTRLIVKSGVLPNQLNLETKQRITAGLLLAVFPCLLFLPYRPAIAGILIAILLGSSFYLNRSLYHFFFRKRGFLFAACAALFHWIYFLYSSLAFAATWITLNISGKNKDDPAGAIP